MGHTKTRKLSVLGSVSNPFEPFSALRNLSKNYQGRTVLRPCGSTAKGRAMKRLPKATETRTRQPKSRRSVEWRRLRAELELSGFRESKTSGAKGLDMTNQSKRQSFGPYLSSRHTKVVSIVLSLLLFAPGSRARRVLWRGFRES